MLGFHSAAPGTGNIHISVTGFPWIDYIQEVLGLKSFLVHPFNIAQLEITGIKNHLQHPLHPPWRLCVLLGQGVSWGTVTSFQAWAGPAGPGCIRHRAPAAPVLCQWCHTGVMNGWGSAVTNSVCQPCCRTDHCVGLSLRSQVTWPMPWCIRSLWDTRKKVSPKLENMATYFGFLKFLRMKDVLNLAMAYSEKCLPQITAATNSWEGLKQGEEKNPCFYSSLFISEPIFTH